MGSDGGYGALIFEQSGFSMQQVWDKIPEGESSLVDEEGDWEVSIQHIFPISSEEEAEKIISAMGCVEDIIGDYDSMKSTTYKALLLDK